MVRRFEGVPPILEVSCRSPLGAEDRCCELAIGSEALRLSTRTRADFGFAARGSLSDFCCLWECDPSLLGHPANVIAITTEKVGKTTIIEVLITNRFEEVVLPVLPVVVVPEDATPDHVHVSIVDTPGGDGDIAKVDEGLSSADVVVLVYAVDNQSSIERVRSFWLDKFRAMELSVPIILVGNKIDTRSGVAQDPRVAQSMEEFIKPIMEDYREVEVCIECSAKNVSNIPEVFYFAQKAVLHPTGPLYNVDTQSLTDNATAALRRVFSLCDKDKDGALNDIELNEFQVKCFSIHLAPDELDGVKKVVKDNRPDTGLTADGFLSVEGFLYLHMLFVQKGRLETTWMVLRKFGYEDDLRLALSESDKLSKSDDQSVELSTQAVSFLTERFNEACSRDDGMLSPEELEALFSGCPDGVFPSSKSVFIPAPKGESDEDIRKALPNGDKATLTQVERGFMVSPERLAGPLPTDSSKLNYMTFDAFMARWALMLSEDPETVMLTLMYIGYNEAPLSALKTTKSRKRDRYHRTVSRNVFNVFVLGDPEVSRVDLVRGLVGESASGIVSPGVAAACDVEVDEAFGGGKRTVVMRDVPESDFASIFGSRKELESCDVMCIVFNSASVESFEQAQRIHAAVLAKGSVVKIPVVFVAARAKSGAEDLGSVLEAGEMYCEKQGLAAPVRVAPHEDEYGNLYQDLVGVALHPHLACPGYYGPETESGSSTAMTALKVAGASVLVGGSLYAAKRIYDYYANKPAGSK